MMGPIHEINESSRPGVFGKQELRKEKEEFEGMDGCFSIFLLLNSYFLLDLPRAAH
jgi:hypothetical protein